MRILKIRKFNTFIFCMMLLAILLSWSSQAQASEELGYTYTVTDGNAQITQYTGSGGTIIIPPTLGGFPVTSIGAYAFAYTGITSPTTITIPSSVISIGTRAFSSLSYLTSIIFPTEGNISIGNEAFMYCSGLTSISLPLSVKSIGNSAFYSCTSVTSINLSPSSVTSIGDNAFWGCNNTSLTNIDIPEGVLSIGSTAFAYCASLETISLPSSLQTIGQKAFILTSLTSISVNSNNPKYTSSDGALYEITGNSLSLIACPRGKTSILFPTNFTAIGDYAFYSCSGLTDVNIPEGVLTIGRGAFEDTSLASISFNSAGTTIFDNTSTIPAQTKIRGYSPSTARDYAAKYYRTFEVIDAATSLQSIAITSSATKLSYNLGETLDIYGLVVTGTYYWNGTSTTNVENITEANITGFDSSAKKINQVLTITVNGKTVTYQVQIVQPMENDTYKYTVDADNNAQITKLKIYNVVGAVDIPGVMDSIYYVTSIGNNAFQSQQSITSISIPNGVTSIGTYAFYLCNGLTTVTLPPTLTSIGDYAFHGCEKLTDINLPQGVKSIGDHTFASCIRLATITLPASLESIGNGAFYSDYNLTSITIPASVTSIGYSAFYGCASLMSINVAETNLNYSSQGGVLYNKSGTSLLIFPAGKTSYNIPESVTSIGPQAFYGCSLLGSIIIPHNVINIGSYAFTGCSWLTSIIFISSGTVIEETSPYANGSTIPAYTTIKGDVGSTAQAYATTYGRTFSPITLIENDTQAQAINGLNIDYPIKVTGDSITITNLTSTSDIIITGNNVHFNNLTNNTGTVYVDPGDGGTTTLEGGTYNDVVVLSGDQNSINLINVRVKLLINQSSSSNVHIHLTGGTIIEATESFASAIFDAEDGSFGTVTLTKYPDGRVPVITLKGNFSVPIVVGGGVSIIAAPGANIPNVHVVVAVYQGNQTVTLSGNFYTVTVNTLSNTKLQLGENTTITKVVALTFINIDIPASSSLTLDNQSGGTINITENVENLALDYAALLSAIDTAESLIGSKTVGTAVGNVSQTVYATFQAAIELAATVRDNSMATQLQVDEQVIALASATTNFNSAIITVDPTNYTELNTAITNATALIGSKTVGTAVGNVSQAVYASFQAVIELATAVNNNPNATQLQVNHQITAVYTGTANFINAIITGVVGNVYSATSIVQIGINPNDGDSAGIFVGLRDIRDTQGNLVPFTKLAGYQIDVIYDHNQAKVLDVYDEAHLGSFTLNNVVDFDKTSVADAVYYGTNNFEKLFFVPLALIGNSSNSTDVVIKFTSLSDTNWNHIMIPDVTLTLQRGKIANEAYHRDLSIVDAVAGLQYLAQMVNDGTDVGTVNVINMASILPPESGTTIIKPSVRDIIALMQKLVGLRNDSFLLVSGD